MKMKNPVRSDIPIPEVRRGRRPVHRFDLLDEPGKSMFIESTPQSIRSCVNLFTRNHQPKWKFRIKPEKDGVRVWRVE